MHTSEMRLELYAAITGDSQSDHVTHLLHDLIECLVHACVALSVRSEAMRSKLHRAIDALTTSELIAVIRYVVKQ